MAELCSEQHTFLCAVHFILYGSQISHVQYVVPLLEILKIRKFSTFACSIWLNYAPNSVRFYLQSSFYSMGLKCSYMYVSLLEVSQKINILRICIGHQNSKFIARTAHYSDYSARCECKGLNFSYVLYSFKFK